MLVTLAVLALLMAQPAAELRSPYLEVVRQYGPGTEQKALAALGALRLSDSDQPADELGNRLCASLAARSCAPADLAASDDDVRDRIHAAWRDLYPRALALHIEALAAVDLDGRRGVGAQRAILRRLIDRLDAIARGPSPPAGFPELARTARHLLVWVLQLRADDIGLADALEAFDAKRGRDPELRLALADLEVLRSLPPRLSQTVDRRRFVAAALREQEMAREERRILERAARAYADALALDDGNVEAQIRLARVDARLGRLDAAAGRLRRLAPIAEPRQAYLAALFLADVEERLGHRAEAIAQYDAARRAWPGAQTAVLGLARLLTLDGAQTRARAALATLTRRDASSRARTDPWHAYDDGQAWRLPKAMLALQAMFSRP